MVAKRTVISSFAVLCVLATTLLATRPAFAQQGKEENEKDEKTQAQQWPPSAPAAKVTPIQAMAAAKKKLGGGTAFQANFEFDEGHWVYGVMVVKGHQISEVEVDPTTGKALDSESVTPSGEAKEAQEELAKIAKTGG